MKAIALLSVLFISAPAFTAEMKAREKTELIVIHHSATKSGNVDTFRKYHKEHNKWDDVGYHYVVTNGNGGADGLVEKGRSEELQGAHAPDRNANSVGICLVGEDSFTEKQKSALVDKIVELCKKYKLSPSAKTIQGHHDKCPGKGLDLAWVIEEVKKKLK